MKYKIIGLICCAVIIATGIIAPIVDGQSSANAATERYQQHLEAEEKAECSHGEDYTGLCSHLPVVCIDTGNVAIPGAPYRGSFTTAANGETYVNATIKIVDNYGTMNHTTDKASMTSSMEIRIRGKSSRYFLKKGYLIKLTNENGDSSAQQFQDLQTVHKR